MRGNVTICFFEGEETSTPHRFTLQWKYRMNPRILLLAFLIPAFAFLSPAPAQELYVESLKSLPPGKSPVSVLRIAPRGDVLGLAGADKSIRLLDPVSLKEKLTLNARSPRVMGLAFSRDGRTMVSAGADGLLSIWSVDAGVLVKEILAHGRGLGVRSVDVDATGKIVSAGGDGEAKFWTMGSDEAFGMLPKGTPESELLSVAFSPSGKYVAVGGADGVVRIFDPQTYMPIKTLSDHKNKVTALAFSPNGKYLATGSADSTVRVWDGETFALLQTLRGGTITALSFNPNNLWLVSAGRAVKVWDVTTGLLRKSLADTAKEYTGAAFLPDSSTLVAATSQGAVETYLVLARKPDREPPTIVVQKPIQRESEPTKIYASEIEVSGIVSDESGVKAAMIGSQASTLTDIPPNELTRLNLKIPSKKFTAVAPLALVGMNDITVSAADERGNIATKNIRVQRLSKDSAVEVLNTKESLETDQISMNLEFKVWFDYVRYTVMLNTIELVNKENIPRKLLGIVHTEMLPLSSGFNQVQLTVYGKGGEKISKILNVTRRILSGPVSLQADKPVRNTSGQPQRWAVVIGLSEYANPTIKNLSYAERDARDFAEFLKSPAGGGFEPERMKILLNKEATLQNIKQALYNFLRQTIDKDLVVIYFAGHGAPEPANPSNNYLLTYDTDPNSLETSAFPMWDVNTALTRYIPSRRVVVFSDACHSGGISSDLATRGVSLTGTNLINQYLADLSKSKEGTIVFTASQAGEVSQELDKYGHGVFTYFLLQGMKGDADLNNDYTVTIGELMDYVEENVKRVTKGNQHPTRNQGSYDRDLTISMIPH